MNTYIPMSFPYPGELGRVKESSDIRCKPGGGAGLGE